MSNFSDGDMYVLNYDNELLCFDVKEDFDLLPNTVNFSFKYKYMMKDDG